MNDNNYVVLKQWMFSRLGLSSANDINIFALIYGFSQDDSSEFKGSAKYISTFFNISRATVMRSLKNLCLNDLVLKASEKAGPYTFIKYKVNKSKIEKLVQINDNSVAK